MSAFKNILVTGGAGFIGANFIHHLFANPEFHGRVVNVDSLTYAGNPDNLTAIDEKHGGDRYVFERVDIREVNRIPAIFAEYEVDVVCHFAAESHVDRSIHGPKDFIETNVEGTFNLLNAARQAWKNRDDVRFHHVSTDEVYGSLGETGFFHETTPYDPRSPYSASKAASDHLARAYFHTYGLPVTITNCSNNYGPYQFPEKIIPVMILNALDERPLPVYGEGKNVRDWLHVSDHNAAVWGVLARGEPGETYNVGGECEKRNIDLVKAICAVLDDVKPRKNGKYEDLITFVKDRPGHDLRYAINCDKLKSELGWKPTVSFEDGLKQTIQWYMDNLDWIERVKSGDYHKWIETNYQGR